MRRFIMKKKLYIIIIIAIVGIIVVSVPIFLKNAAVLDYKLDSYSYVCVKDDSVSWLQGAFDIQEDEINDIVNNPKEYYVVTFDGYLRNNHIYDIYDWYVVDSGNLTENKYWVDSSTVEGTFAFEPFSEAFWQTKILIKCSPEEVVKISDNILMNQLLIAQGTVL